MRNVINFLCQKYGEQHTAAITDWVNIQYLFESTVDGVTLSLRNVDEHEIVRSLDALFLDLKLPVELFLNGVWLVPVLTDNQLAIKASAELRPALFQALLGPLISTNGAFAAFNSDIVERFGSDSHIKVTSGDSNPEVKELQCIYLNLTAKLDGGDQAFSVMLNAEELAEIRRMYLEDKFHGANPFSSAQWLELQGASVYRRLFNDCIFGALESVMQPESVHLYRQCASFGHDDIKADKEEGSSLIYSEWGRVIGRKVIRHNVIDLLVSKSVPNACQEGAVSGAVVPFARPVSVSDGADKAADVCQDWGVF